MSFFESVVANDVKQSQLRVTPTLITWTESKTLFGADDAIAKDQYLPMQAYLTGDAEIVVVGSNHPVYPDAICQQVAIGPSTDDSTTHLTQVASYAQPGPFCSVLYGTYQQTEVRNFSEDQEDAAKAGLTPPPTKTNLTTVTYTPPNFSAGFAIGPTPAGAPQGPTINLLVPFVANITVPSIVRSIRVIQYEVLKDADAIPSAISDQPRPVWNVNPIWGYHAGELLYIGVQSTSEGTALYRREYTFLINPYKWHHFYAVWVDSRGLKPRDIVPINPNDVDAADATVRSNGTAGFRMLPKMDFATRFDNLKAPFNVGNVTTTDIPNPLFGQGSDTDPLGDFSPMPVSVA